MTETEDYSKEAIPKAHKTTHQNGGSDEIAVDGLSGQLADSQPSTWALVDGKPSTFDPSLHHTSHENGGSDEIGAAGLSGQLADSQPSTWTLVSGKPTTFAPEAHKTSHQDAGSDEIDLTGLTGKAEWFDRGDPVASDFNIDHLTLDGTWRDLDFSAIVPAGTRCIHMRIIVAASAAGALFQMRKNGNANTNNSATIYSQVATVLTAGHFWVPCDANRVLEYKGPATTFTSVFVCVCSYLT